MQLTNETVFYQDENIIITEVYTIVFDNASALSSQATMLKIVAPQVVTECGMPKRRHINRPTSQNRL